MIQQAKSLSISNIFTVTETAFPFSGPPLYPAIAIPVKAKAIFECPDGHLTALGALIPKVTKIVTVGWRGFEQHFLNLLHHGLSGLSFAVDAVTVAASHDEATETMRLLCGTGTPIRPKGSFGGFSDSVENRSFDSIFAAKTP